MQYCILRFQKQNGEVVLKNVFCPRMDILKFICG